MITLHIVVLVVLLAVFGFIALLALCDTLATQQEMPMKAKVFVWTMTAFFAAWFVGTMTRPARVNTTEVYTPSEINLPNGMTVSVLAYDGEDGQPITVNLNARLKGSVPKGIKVKVTTYHKSPYCGISWGGWALQDKIEIARESED